MCERTILAPINVCPERCYTDNIFLNRVLNSQETTGLPPHRPSLKCVCLTIILKNLEPPQLCNSTRLAVEKMLDNFLEAIIVRRKGTGEPAFIPRVPFIATNYVFAMKRVQFPIRLSFNMTINKAQGQSREVVGLDLNTIYFSHVRQMFQSWKLGESLLLRCRKIGEKLVYKATLQ